MTTRATVVPDRDDLATAEALLEAAGVLRRQTRRRVGRPWPLSELSGAQVELVRLVRRHPGIGVNEAAAQLGLAGNTVSTMVRRLVSMQVLTREPDRADRRVARLRLSSSAAGRVERWRDERAAALAETIAGLPTRDRDVLAAVVPVLGELAERLRAGEAGQHD